jgi:hypothetical protein
MLSSPSQLEEKTGHDNIRDLHDFLHRRSFSRKPSKPSKDVRDQTGPGPFSPRVRLYREFKDLLVQWRQEASKAHLPQILHENARILQQLLTLRKDSRRLLPSNAGNSLSIPSPISRRGIRHYSSLSPADLGGSGLCVQEQQEL